MNFSPFVFQKFNRNDYYLFFKNLIDKKKHEVKLNNFPKRNEDYKTVTYGCIQFLDSFEILSSSLVLLVKTLVDIKHKTVRNLKKNLEMILYKVLLMKKKH